MTNNVKGALPEASRQGAHPSVPMTPDRATRRIQLHHVLVRRRRWAKAMDQHVKGLAA